MTTTKSNPVGWFEIPVTDMKRATTFYQTVFQCTLTSLSMGPLEMMLFPMQDNGTGASGALVQHADWYKPSSFDGVLVYFTAMSGDCAVELERVRSAGGTVLQEKKSLGTYGDVAFFLDSEGNRIALHNARREN
jgi:predicted enzyme related to lactoylglutathione lyase